VFISYRRGDSGPYARNINDTLSARFGHERVFYDIDSIAPGRDFVDVLGEILNTANVLLVVIGPGWANVTDEQGGRRLDDPEDYVRLEVETALARPDLLVIPVLVGGAKMPAARSLPDTLAPLTRRNATSLTDEHWRATMDELIGILERVDVSPVDLGIDGVTDALLIGQGGFGSVYRAMQPRYRRVVAVKVLTLPLDAATRTAFDRECQALGSLSSHPNIVTLHEAGATAFNRPYLIMEYLPGGSIDERLRAGQFPWEDALAVGVKLAGALACAHTAGVLHRDIKPDNVLFSSYGEPKLADFGVARLFGATRTASGAFSGSLTYAAPETLSGVSATEASDIWSLASTIAAMIAGRPPFGSPSDTTLEGLITRILTADPIDLRTVGAPEPVRVAIERALAKDSWRRPQTAAAFGESLQDAQRHVGVSVTPMVSAPPGEAPAAAAAGAPPAGPTSAHAATSGAPAPAPEPSAPPAPSPRAAPTLPPKRRSRRAVAVAAASVVVIAAVGAFLAASAGGAHARVGSPWHPQASGTGETLYSAAFPDPRHGWAVGSGGTVDSTSDGGKTWAAQVSGTSQILGGVAFVDDQRGWIVGPGGTILATDRAGALWAPQSSGTTNDLYGLTFIDAERGWVVGAHGTVLVTADAGGTWAPRTSGSQDPLHGVAFVDPNRGWVTGGAGTILATTDGGHTWSTEASGVATTLYRVAFLDADHGWAAGVAGTIVATTDGGQSWRTQRSGTTRDLYRITFSDVDHGWASGAAGTIITTTDGGVTWAPQRTNTSADLYGLAFTDATHGWAVGSDGTILGFVGAPG
jgi:photosystem II stability/assembly factor-like uncharacterized protein